MFNKTYMLKHLKWYSHDDKNNHNLLIDSIESSAMIKNVLNRNKRDTVIRRVAQLVCL